MECWEPSSDRRTDTEQNAKQTRNIMEKLLYEKESYLIIGGAFEIYKQFRNRHKEIVYLRAYSSYLKDKGLFIETEKQIPVYFNGKKVGIYTPDIIVNNCIFIELKCKPKLSQDDIKQFWYYLKATDYKIGFLINFGASNGVEFIRRIYDSARKK